MAKPSASDKGAAIGPAAPREHAREGFKPAEIPTQQGPSFSSGSEAVEQGPSIDYQTHGDERDINNRLRERNAEISQLAGGLAHEIRNPLSTLSLNLDLLAEDFEGAETPRDRRVLQRVGRLRDEVRRLNDILENFLRFARIQELKLESTDLNVLVDELRDFYEPQASTQGIVVRVFAASDLPTVMLDAPLFKQALLNLIFNAEHAMLPEGGELILSTRLEGKWVILDVTDTGTGMSNEVRSKIFDAFYSTRKAGTGLGLPIARKIIEANGGTISVQSEVGQGSQFTIRFPASPRSAGS